jgi:hypothetical protein
MPLPAAWKPLRNVGTARRDRSDTAARSNAQVGRSFWSSQLTGRATRDPILFEIRCRHVLGLSKETGAPPTIEPASCLESRQCTVSSCDHAEPISCAKALYPDAFISATVQPGVEPGRKGMEVGAQAVYSQSVFPIAQRSGRRCNNPIGAMEKTEQSTPTIMRHYLRRPV